MNETEPRPVRRPAMSLWGLIEVAGILLCAATLAGFLARLWWVLELTCHFRLHLAVGLTLLTVIWLVKRHWWRASVCGAFALLNAVLVLLVFWPDERAGAHSGAPLRLVSLNVHTDNLRTDRVLDYLQRADADVILLLEVNESWMNALHSLRTSYAHGLAEPRADNFGIALFSRLPLTNSAVIELGQAEVPSIATTLDLDGQRVFLLGTHPLPPGSAEYARLRNGQLQEIAALIRRRGAPAIVLGDLNCTPWSPYFTALLREGGLKNAAPQGGLFGSWPAWFPFARIPLDHGLVSPSLRVMGKRIGPFVGSDHLPLMLELEIPHSDSAVLPPPQ